MPETKLKLSINLFQIQYAAVPMHGFCECQHDVPPMLADLRAFQALLQKSGGQPNRLDPVEYGYMLDRLLSAIQTQAVMQHLPKIVQILSAESDHPASELPWSVLMNVIVHEFMESQYLPHVAPERIARINKTDCEDMDYLLDLEFDYLQFIQQWIELDRIVVAELLTVFTVLWCQNVEVSIPLLEDLTRQESTALLKQIEDLTRDMQLKHSLLPYVPLQPKQVIFDSL